MGVWNTGSHFRIFRRTNFSAMVRIVLAFGLLLCGLNIAFAQAAKDRAKTEILAIEARFQQMALDSGVAVAFERFAAPDAVISRDDVLLVGLDAIVKHMKGSRMTEVRLFWTPDFLMRRMMGPLATPTGSTPSRPSIPKEDLKALAGFFIPYGNASQAERGSLFGISSSPLFSNSKTEHSYP